MAIDLDCRGTRMSLVFVYFRHSGFKDETVEALRAAIGADIEAAKKRGATTLVGGDFNAEIGGRQPGEPESIIGTHADGTRNRRGEMMAKWAWASKLTIVNSRFQKPWEKMWTHIRQARKRVINYFCIEKLKRGAVQDLEVWEEVNLGSHHRAVRIILQIRTAKRASGQK